MKVYVETHSGEQLIGEIVESPQNFLGNGQQLPFMMFDNGIWLKRKTHLSFIAESEIKVKRPATVFDREKKI